MRWLVLLLASATIAYAHPRADFAAKMAKVKPGMTADEVKKLLGAPDDIQSEVDGISATRTVEIWRYGTAGHMRTATLGSVHIQADGKVQYEFGAMGTPFTAMKEPELRRLLELIDAVPSYNDVLDPLTLVRAVNALQSLDKDTALDVVDEYLRVSSPFDNPGREGVFLIMRTLFDVPPNGMPPMMVGAPSPAAPKNAKQLLPRFPITIVADVPLKVVAGYMLAGKAERPEDDVAAFRRVGDIRTQPLAPSTNALEDIEVAIGRLGNLVGIERAYLMDQALRFFGTVYRPGNWGRSDWPRLRAEIEQLHITWNSKAMQMEHANGTTLPAFKRTRPVVWDFKAKNTKNARVRIERTSDDQVQVEVGADATGVVDEKLRLLDVRTGTAVVDLVLRGTTGPILSAVDVTLALGAQVRPVLASGARGPVLTP